MGLAARARTLPELGIPPWLASLHARHPRVNRWNDAIARLSTAGAAARYKTGGPDSNLAELS